MHPSYRDLSVALALTLVLSHATALGQAETLSPKRVSIGEGVGLHYVELGEGDPVIFIHGLAGDYAVWSRQLEAFAASGYRAIAYSRRYSYPNKNEIRPHHSASVDAADLAALMRELKLPPAHLVGHSYGGYAALICSLENPHSVRTLTLAEAPLVPWLADLPGAYAEEGEAHLERLMTEGVHPAKAAFASGDDEAALRAIIDCIADKPVYDRLPGFVKDRCRKNLADVKAVITSEDRYPAVERDRIRRLAVPTLILSGGESRSAARLTDLELERLIPEGSRERVVLPGATHLMWQEQPAPCRQAVLRFIHGK